MKKLLNDFSKLIHNVLNRGLNHIYLGKIVKKIRIFIAV